MNDVIQVELAAPIRPLFDGKARYRIAHGGRGGFKSHSMATMAVLKAYQQKTLVLCARELQNSIKDSVYKLLKDKIEQPGLAGFVITDSSIKHVNGSEFVFKGLQRNSQEIKSFEGADICWVEEAQKVSAESWGYLIPTIRKEGSEIWVSMNPEFEDDPASQLFLENPPPNSKKVQTFYFDNPWLTDELRAEAEHCRKTDPKGYEHIWLGGYRDPNHGGKVIPAWSIANVDEFIKYDPDRKIYLSCDFNVDPMCWAIAHIVEINDVRHYQFFDEICIENTTISLALNKFIEKYGDHKAGIIVTGDANSGRARSDGDDVSRTRWQKMHQILSDSLVKNFALDYNTANPRIKARIEAFNSLVCSAEGIRRVKVAPNCKQILHNLEKLTYKPGTDEVYNPASAEIKDKPALKFLKDDMFDAVSYLTWKYDPFIPPENDDDDEEPAIIEFEV